VCFKFQREDFSLVTPDERRVTEPGKFILMVGPSSKDSDLLRAEFVLTKPAQ
jgi:beta-glucosidase